MAEFVNITFNQDVDERFNNTVSSGPAATNNLDGVVIDASEMFDGDGSGRWNNLASTFIQLASDTDFNFGGSLTLYMKLKFFLLSDGRFGLVGRRGDQNNRWHIIIDTTDSTTPKLVFFANDASTGAHNVDFDFSGVISQLTLGRWHTLEMACDSANVRFWIDGKFITLSTDGGGLTIDASNSTVEVGRVNQSATGTADFVTFDRYIDSIVFDTTLPAGYTSNTDHSVRTWTGNTELLEVFSPVKEPQPNILDQTAFPNNIPDFELASNQCFIAGLEVDIGGGEYRMRKVDGTSVLDIGMAKPGTVSFSGGSSGSNYDYVVTWIDARGNESGPSPVSSQRSTTSNTIDRPASPPTQATHWRVYRRHASAGQALHYRVSPEIAVGTSTWAESGVVESLTFIAPTQDVDLPPISNHIAYNLGRMYYGNVRVGTDRYSTRVYYSALNELEQVGANSWFYVGDDDSEVITGLVKFRGNLVIFKERSVYVAVGDPQDSGFQVIDISRSIGCVAHQTIKEAGNRLMWLDDEGVYAWAGDTDPILVSEFVEPYIENMPDARKPYASAAVDAELGLYLISLSLEQTDENDFVLCYNYRDSFRDLVHRWSRWPLPLSSLGDGFVGLGRDARAFFADKSGKVGLFERGLDLNAGIDFVWKSGRFNPWNPGSPMNIHYLTVMSDLVTVGDRRIHVGYELDEQGEQLSLFDNPTVNNMKIRVAGRSDYISVVLKGTDIRERMRMYGFRFDGNPIGKR